jgi:ApaG protein
VARKPSKSPKPSNEPEELEGLWVSIDKVEHHPELHAEPARPHPFVYFITIHNDSVTTVDILARKWVVTDADGNKQVVEGAGVVGERPHLPPGESFTYNSYHIIGSNSVAEGAYFGTAADGRKIFTRIPPFEMRVLR